MKQLLILGMIATLACSAFAAYPTLSGPSGLATLPDAGIAPTGQFMLAADYWNAEEWLGTTYPIRFLYGVNESLELGAIYWINNDDDANAWGINGKYVLPIALGNMPWAVGASYQNFSDWDENFIQVYFVGTKAFTEAADTMPGFKGTIGANWSKDTWNNGDSTDSAVRFFVGLEADFANKLALAGEFQTKNDNVDNNAIWSLVARYPFTGALSGQIGYTNAFGPFGWMDDSHLFAGVAYTFGAAAE